MSEKNGLYQQKAQKSSRILLYREARYRCRQGATPTVICQAAILIPV